MADSSFFEEVQESIWLLKIDYNAEKEEDILEDSTGFGAGFALTSNGVIMSVAHIVPSVPGYQITARRKNDTSFFKVTVLDCIRKYDISVLKIEGIKNCEYRNLARDGSVYIGEEIIHIGHPMVWSLIKGRVAYPCKESDVHLPIENLECENDPYTTTFPYRRVGNIFTQNYLSSNSTSDSSRVIASILHPNVPLVQMNFLVDFGSSGGPVFNANKEIIGMQSFGGRRQALAIHVSLLKYVFLEFEKKKKKEKSKKSRHSSRH